MQQKTLNYVVAGSLGLVLTRVGSLGLPRYVFDDFERHFPSLQGEPSRVVAGLVFLGPSFLVASLVIAALMTAIQKRLRYGGCFSILLAPSVFAACQSLAVAGYAALGIHIFNAAWEVIAAGITGFVFGGVFCIAVLSMSRSSRAGAA